MTDEKHDTEEQVFKRLTFVQRGHITNYPTFFPVMEIGICSGGIIFKRRLKEYKYTWPEIQSVFIETGKSFKSYGGAGGDFMQRVLVIRTSNHKFAFDISSNFPDFKNGKLIVEELKKRLEIKQVKRSRRIQLDSIIVIVFIIVLFVFLKLTGWHW